MEDIKNKLTERNYYFLKRFQEYIGTELLFFGSIKRCDFLLNYSDIDIAIITDNIEETIIKLKHYLNIDNRKMRKIIQKFSKDSNIVHGYKTNYDDIDNQLSLEILIYDNKYKKQVLKSINNTNNFPFYISYFLLFIKLLYYNLNIIPKETFNSLKKIIIQKYLNQSPNNMITTKI